VAGGPSFVVYRLTAINPWETESHLEGLPRVL